MPRLRSRSLPERAGERAAELAGRRAWQNNTIKAGKWSLRAVGIEGAPAACGSGLTSHVADCGGEQDHHLQLRQVACNHGDSGGHEFAHDGCRAGRCYGCGATSAEASRLHLLQLTGRRHRVPVSTPFDAAVLSQVGFRWFLCTRAAHHMRDVSAGLAERRPCRRDGALQFVTSCAEWKV